jgi:hypothetical protein
MKYLDASFCGSSWIIKLPEALDLPKLEICHLRKFAFASNDTTYVCNPFISSKRLN